MKESTANIDPKYTGNPDEKYPEHWQGIELFRNCFTLYNIFKYASDEELEAIVHSIWNRIKYDNDTGGYISHREAQYVTDKVLHKIAKGLRKPQ